MLVKETRTEVDVMWQDGSVKTERTCDLIPHINIDEYDCWLVSHNRITRLRAQIEF